MQCKWKLAHSKRVHAAVRRQSDWSNRKYSLPVPSRKIVEYQTCPAYPAGWHGREGRNVPTKMIPRYPSSPKLPQAPKHQAPLHFLARAPAAQCACPSRSHIGGNGRLRLLSFPATPAITATLAPPALSGCARSGPHHERADEEGAPRGTRTCALPHLGDTTQTLLPCIASHHTAHATQTPNDNSTRHILISSNLSDPRMLHPLPHTHSRPYAHT